MSRSFATIDASDEKRPDAEDREPMTVIDWLLDSDPAIRWQVLRDLTDEPAEAVAAERARVAHEGWGARLLSLQAPDGRWGGRPWSLDYTDTFHTLEMLRLFGLDPRSDEANRAVGLVRDRVIWKGGAPVETPWDDHRFFEGEVEPCINGNVVASGSYFGVDVTPLVERLLGEQLPDGGWNCEVENGATVSSFGTTINVLEALLLHERAKDRPDVTEARRRGEAYMLKRRLFRRKSTGEVIDPEWLRFSFPTWWHYDLLRGLDYLRDAGVAPDGRVAEAISIVEGNRDRDGRWPLQNVHEGETHFEMEGSEGTPSRWNTLRAMRVLRWWNEGSRVEAAALAAKEA
jgi:hypothetical protein